MKLVKAINMSIDKFTLTKDVDVIDNRGKKWSLFKNNEYSAKLELDYCIIEDLAIRQLGSLKIIISQSQFIDKVLPAIKR